MNLVGIRINWLLRAFHSSWLWSTGTKWRLENLQVAIVSQFETLSVLRELEYTLLELYPSVCLRVCDTCNLISRFSFLSHDACDAGSLLSLLPQMLEGVSLSVTISQCASAQTEPHISPQSCECDYSPSAMSKLNTTSVHLSPPTASENLYHFPGRSWCCATGHSTFLCIRRYLFQTHMLNPYVTRELSS